MIATLPFVIYTSSEYGIRREHEIYIEMSYIYYCRLVIVYQIIELTQLLNMLERTAINNRYQQIL